MLKRERQRERERDRQRDRETERDRDEALKTLKNHSAKPHFSGLCFDA